jgi:putative DNA primase/helicase
MKAFGDYSYNPDCSIFTSTKKSSSGANSEIARGKGRRIWMMTELEEGSKLNTAELKKKSGGEKIQARGLYKDFIEYEPQMMHFLQMNSKKDLDNYDGGTIRRVFSIYHPNKFVNKDEDKLLPHERQGDSNIKNSADRRIHCQRIYEHVD